MPGCCCHPNLHSCTADRLPSLASPQPILTHSASHSTELPTCPSYSSSTLPSSTPLQVISAGSDGLVKLWNIRTSECISTFDEHEDKVWALALGGPGEKVMATGGGDAVVAVWEDVTEADQAAAQEQEEELLQKEQALQNALVVGGWAWGGGCAAGRLCCLYMHVACVQVCRCCCEPQCVVLARRGL
jgi:hypothetical protein